MSAETDIYDTLIADQDVLEAVVAGSPIDPTLARIYPDFLSQTITLPAIVIQRAETEYINTIHSGDVVGGRIVMDAWCLAATRIGAEALADLVEAALPNGPVGNEFRVINRRPEFDPDTLTHAAIVSSVIWT